MSKTWSIAAHEFARHVFRWRFVLGLLSLPAFVGMMALVIFLLIRSETDRRPVGYVDHSGVLSADPPTGLPVEMIAFDSEGEAAQALEAERIQAYFLIGSAYPESRRVELFSLDDPSETAIDGFEEFLRYKLLTDQPGEVVRRLLEGDQLEVQSSDGGRRLQEGDWLGLFFPILVGFFFMIAVFATTGYLMQAVIEEKENRTMEVIMTSVTPGQFMTGKILGIVGVGGTQLLVWTGFIAVFLLLGSRAFGWFDRLHVSPVYLLQVAAIFLPAFVMIAALMVAIGSTVGEAQEAQQFTGMFTFPAFLPYWFALQLMSNPHGPLAVGLSVFPLTAPVAYTLRAGFAQIPVWQFLLSLLVISGCAVAAIWLAGRTFRLGMLRYGQRLNLREIFGSPRRGA